VSTSPRRRIWTWSALGLAASAGLHLAVISFLVWSIRPTSGGPDAAPIEVSLWSPPAPPHRPPPRVGPQARAPAEAAPREAVPGEAVPAPLPLPTDQSVHATDAVRSLLRASVGCDHAAAFHLTADELEQCRGRARRLGEGEAQFAVRPHDPRKLAAFDQAARDNDAARRAREGPMSTPIPICSGPGSNFSGGCLSPHYKKAAADPSEAGARGPWH
jgi:hypothetical protein